MNTVAGPDLNHNRPEPLVVIGAGGHGRETVSLLKEALNRGDKDWELLGVVCDTRPDSDLLSALGVDWLGPVEALRTISASFNVAIGDGHVRQRLQTRWQGAGLEPATLIHWSASVGFDVEIGRGCYIGPLTAVTTHIRLHDGVQVNSGCTISHDVVLGEFATVAPGVRLTGGVVVEAGATVYAGATVLPRIRIGEGAVVGAGAVVASDVAPGTTVAGIPARLIRPSEVPSSH